MHLEKRVDGQMVFEGRIIKVFHDRVELENGRLAVREVITHPGAVGVLACRGDRLIMVRQYRYAVGRELMEIPAGKLEPGEQPEPAALRELREETGLLAGSLIFLGDYYASPGVYSEVIHLYYAQPEAEGPAAPDENEFVSAEAVPIARFEAMLAAGQVPDGKTVCAFALARARGLI